MSLGARYVVSDPQYVLIARMAAGKAVATVTAARVEEATAVVAKEAAVRAAVVKEVAA